MIKTFGMKYTTSVELQILNRSNFTTRLKEYLKIVRSEGTPKFIRVLEG